MTSIGNHGEVGAVVGDVVVYVQEVDPRRTSGKRPLHLKTWSTVKDLKQALQHLLHVPMNKQRLFFNGQELGRRGSIDSSKKGPHVAMRELKKYSHSLQDCGIVRDGETIYFAIAPSLQDDVHHRSFLRTYGLLNPPKRLVRSIKQVHRALEIGINNPKLTVEGFGGTYFMYDPRKRPLACFKPSDEEPYTPNNPRGRELVANWGLVGKESFAMRPGVKPGEGYVREVAAYVLDHGGFSGVPATTIVEAKHKAFHTQDGKEAIKVGSFQEFVKHDAVVEDLSPSLFSRHEVQKIAVLDIRLLNSDRNGGNILVRRKQSARRDGGFTPVSSMTRSHNHEYELIPIDHGYCLPEEICIDDSLNLCWFEWRQVKEPMDKETVAFIESLDAEKDAQVLRQKLGIREAALDNLWLSTQLLKFAAVEKLTLHDVATIVVREASDMPSELEKVKETAEALAHAVTRSSRQKHKDGQGGRLKLLVGKDYMVPPATSPRSGNGDEQQTPRFSQTSACSSMEDLPSLLARNPSLLASYEGNGMDPLVSGGPGGSAPLKIRLDVIEGGEEFPCPSRVTRGDHRIIQSPSSPIGFWRESLAEMNARASMAAAKAASDVLLSHGGGGGDGSIGSYSSSTTGGDGGDRTPLAHEDSIGSRCSERSDPATVRPTVFPGFFADPDVLAHPQQVSIHYLLRSTTSGSLSDDDVENAPVNGSRGSAPSSRRTLADVDDSYAWTFDMDVENDGPSYGHAAPPALAGSSSSSSSGSSPSAVSPSSSPEADQAGLSRSPAAAPAPARSGHQFHGGDHNNHYDMSARTAPLLSHPVSGTTAAGAVTIASTSSGTKQSGRLVRALSSPDLKKHGFLKGTEGEGFSRCVSTSRTTRYLKSRREDTRESSEFRGFYFHYANLLLRDLVKRRAKQKGLLSM